MNDWKEAAKLSLETTLEKLRNGTYETFSSLADAIAEEVLRLQEIYISESEPMLWVDGFAISESELSQIVDAVMIEQCNVDDVLQKIGTCEEPIEFTTTPARAFILISQLQLALRHPDNRGSSAEISYQIAQNLSRAICSIVPESYALIESGWKKHLDMSREEFARRNSGGKLVTEEDPTENAIVQSSQLLQGYSATIGQPLILVGNFGLNHTPNQLVEGAINDGDRIKGITIAWACNAQQAQVIVTALQNALQELLK